MEHIFVTRLQQLYTETPEEFCFRDKRSSARKMLRVIEFFHDVFDKSEMNGALYIPVTKEFYEVWHYGRIYKLLNLKIAIPYVQFIFSYLRKRISVVRYATKLSTQRIA